MTRGFAKIEIEALEVLVSTANGYAKTMLNHPAVTDEHAKSIATLKEASTLGSDAIAEFEVPALEIPTHRRRKYGHGNRVSNAHGFN